ncbi:MAG: hypothetical protein ACRDXX_06720 [Stackebrandtia sp.]
MSRIPTLHTRLSEIVTWAEEQLEDEHTDGHQLAETLVERLAAIRDQFPDAAKPQRGHTVVQTMGVVERGGTVVGVQLGNVEE